MAIPSSNVTLHTKPSRTQSLDLTDLPNVISTPAGLALLELQGTINLPDRANVSDEDAARGIERHVEIGKMTFPEYDARDTGRTGLESLGAIWMYVGKHQRLAGTVKKLPKAMAIVRRRGEGQVADGEDGVKQDLEIVEIVKYKIIFSSRPEPVGDDGELVA